MALGITLSKRGPLRSPLFQTSGVLCHKVSCCFFTDGTIIVVIFDCLASLLHITDILKLFHWWVVYWCYTWFYDLIFFITSISQCTALVIHFPHCTHNSSNGGYLEARHFLFFLPDLTGSEYCTPVTQFFIFSGLFSLLLYDFPPFFFPFSLDFCIYIFFILPLPSPIPS